MTIWKATLVVLTQADNTTINKFWFEKQDKEYEENKNFPEKEWCNSEGWIFRRIPKNMVVEETYDNFQVIQGFNRELNEHELLELEKNMKIHLIEHLKDKKEQILEMYDAKINSLEQTI